MCLSHYWLQMRERDMSSDTFFMHDDASDERTLTGTHILQS